MNSIILKHRREIARALQRHKYGVEGGKIHLEGESRLNIGGAFKVNDHGGPIGLTIEPNLFVTQGLIQLLNSAFAGGAQISNWYLALFSNDYTPVAGLTAAAFPGTAGEINAGITSATRPAWNRAAAVATPDVGNSGDEALFTYAAGGPYNVYGVALLSSSVKGGTGGVLAAASRFAVSRLNQIAGDKLGIEYIISASDDS